MKKAQSLEQFVIARLSEQSGGKSISRQSDLVRDLDVDSMAMVTLIFSIDEEFTIGTDRLGDMVASCRTVGELVDAAEASRLAQV